MNELCVAYESARMNGEELARVYEILMWDKEENCYVRLSATNVLLYLSNKGKIIFLTR